jgi:hypothetical protein
MKVMHVIKDGRVYKGVESFQVLLIVLTVATWRLNVGEGVHMYV